MRRGRKSTIAPKINAALITTRMKAQITRRESTDSAGTPANAWAPNWPVYRMPRTIPSKPTPANTLSRALVSAQAKRRRRRRSKARYVQLRARTSQYPGPLSARKMYTTSAPRLARVGRLSWSLITNIPVIRSTKPATSASPHSPSCSNSRCQLSRFETAAQACPGRGDARHHQEHHTHHQPRRGLEGGDDQHKGGQPNDPGFYHRSPGRGCPYDAPHRCVSWARSR